VATGIGFFPVVSFTTQTIAFPIRTLHDGVARHLPVEGIRAWSSLFLTDRGLWSCDYWQQYTQQSNPRKPLQLIHGQASICWRSMI